MAKKINPARFKAKARRYFVLKETAKQLYQKADLIAGEIGKALGGGASIEIGEGRAILVKDNFAEAAAKPEKYPNPTAWNMCAARQFELEMK